MDIDIWQVTVLKGLRAAQKLAHATAIDKGWWDAERENDAEKIALIHSELSEALEALRAPGGIAPSDKLPQFNGVEEEFADVIIRIFDLAERRGWNVPEAVVHKMEYNRSRPHRHGGKKF